MKAPRGKRVAMCVVAVGLAVLGTAGWLARPHLRFWWLFEPLGRNQEGYLEFRHRQTGIVMVKVPAGRFTMGASDEEHEELLRSVHPDSKADLEGFLASEKPSHEVELTSFLIAKHEVRQEDWMRVMGSNPAHFQGRDLPVEQVSWNDCQDFCRKTGLRLPTEAQWEYACRAETAGAYGGIWRLEDMGWYDENSGSAAHPVGQKRPNHFGLHDMHGNVFEWCEDLYDFEFYRKPEACEKDPLCTSGPGMRVARGGSFDEPEMGCRSARRLGFSRSFQSIGFRPAYGPLP